MDDHGYQQNAPGAYIWLRYATQYTRDGQAHTFEMSIPVPLGATAEEREQLIREAESGMRQLTGHVEQRVTQPNAQRVQSNPAPKSTQTLQTPRPTTPLTKPTPRPASMPAPQTGPQPATGQANDAPEREESAPARQGVAANMSTHTLSPNESSTSLQLPQFIQYIKENLDLTPKQAMDLLNVKSLSTGINLRDALENLKRITAQQKGQQDTPSSAPRRTVYESSPSVTSTTNPEPVSRRVSGPLSSTTGAAQSQRTPEPIFDEEVEPDELDDSELDSMLGEDDGPDMGNELSQKQLEQARAKISELRESQGAATVNEFRLKVLNNVVNSQITEDQLQSLIEGVWNIPMLKRLKVDQVEALISWAKMDDDFVEQVDAVLAVLEEERYARGNR
jgi:hypothetical protein